MKHISKRISVILLSTVICCVFCESTVFALSKIGSQGQEVTNIQTRLKSWGYYSGSIDGIYGWRTANAVKEFQRKHGLTADGISGSATLSKIGLPTGSSSSSYSNDTTLLAMVINGEARGESYEGQVAVPNTIAGVVYQPGAFTAVDDGQINKAIQSSCYNAARDALNGWDPTGGAIYYYNPSTATSSWIRTRPIIKTIGKHVFCK